MIQRKIKTKLVGKKEVFQMLALGESTGLPVLLLGEPGVGKTQALLDYALAKYQDKQKVRENTFVIELDEGTKTSEIKGRPNMKTLLEDKEYKIDAPITDAKYVLINEVDKGTSGVRNTLLSIMREKAIFYGNEIKKCDWEIFAGSCNIIPEEEIDSPFWDRFILTCKVDRIGVEQITNIWDVDIEGGHSLNLNMPTKEEITNTSLNKATILKFLDVIYTKISDRTASYIPMLVKAIKLIYELEDVEAVLKCCEFISPSNLNELIGKLESKREANIRSQINSLEGVVKGNNDAYTQLFLTQICDSITEMAEMNTYKKKVQLLVDDITNILYKLWNDDTIIENEQYHALLTVLKNKLDKTKSIDEIILPVFEETEPVNV